MRGDRRPVQHFNHAAAGMSGGHQGREGPETAAFALVAAHAEKDVIEEVEAIATAFEQAEALR